MCLILFALQQHADFPLIVIANRDEYYARPTRSAHWWEDSREVFAGRDLEAGGTWMGVNRNGRFAAVTNVREPGISAPARLSRGKLTRDFLSDDETAEDFIEHIRPEANDYAGFNLIVGDSSNLFFYSNRQSEVIRISPGIHGVSNGRFNEDWPKLTSGKAALSAELEAGADDLGLMQILTDNAIAADEHLPETGVGLDFERMLSSRFIRSPSYGTRACSLVKFNRQQKISFVEQNYLDAETIGERISEQIDISP
jgi:uncharacterized protein with NRDE domain